MMEYDRCMECGEKTEVTERFIDHGICNTCYGIMANDAMKQQAEYEDRLKGLYDKLNVDVIMLREAIASARRWFENIDHEFTEIGKIKGGIA